MFFSPVRCSIFVLSSLLSATNGLSSSEGLRFRRVTSFDDFKVPSDGDALDLFVRTLTECASQCSRHAWCASFFFTKATRACSLHNTVYVDAPTVAVTSSGTRYYTNVVAWCSPQNEQLYIRQAQMCIYFEMDPNKKASTWSTADDACATRGMRLASNLSPLKMDALVTITQKNPALSGAIYIGLKRTAPGASTLVWVDNTPLDVAAMLPFWEVNQPNGACCNQDCVIIRAFADSTINDVTCGYDHEFVCELLLPLP